VSQSDQVFRPVSAAGGADQPSAGTGTEDSILPKVITSPAAETAVHDAKGSSPQHGEASISPSGSSGSPVDEAATVRQSAPGTASVPASGSPGVVGPSAGTRPASTPGSSESGKPSGSAAGSSPATQPQQVLKSAQPAQQPPQTGPPPRAGQEAPKTSPAPAGAGWAVSDRAGQSPAAAPTEQQSIFSSAPEATVRTPQPAARPVPSREPAPVTPRSTALPINGMAAPSRPPATQAQPTSRPGIPPAPAVGQVPFRPSSAPAAVPPAPVQPGSALPPLPVDAPAHPQPMQPQSQFADPEEARQQVSSSGPRKVKLTVARIDPWSAMKMSFLLSVAFGIATVVAGMVIWEVLNAMGVFAQLNSQLRDIAGPTSKFDLSQYVGIGRVISLATFVAVVNVVVTMALATLGAVLYNIAGSLVGGLNLTLSDD